MITDPGEPRLPTQSTPEQIAEAQRQIDAANAAIESGLNASVASTPADLVTQIERALAWAEHDQSGWWFEKAKDVVRAAPKGQAQVAIETIERRDIATLNGFSAVAGQQVPAIPAEWLQRRGDHLRALRRVLAE